MVARARDRGRVAKEFFVIHTSPTGDLGQVEANLKPHLDYQHHIEEIGVLFAAGPLGDVDGVGWSGEGMIIVRAATLEEATRIAAADPMHVSGARRCTVRPWVMNEGSVTIRLRCSDRTMEMS
ncbi:MAG: YciI family protein [Dongiaceae bacterium]